MQTLDMIHITLQHSTQRPRLVTQGQIKTNGVISFSRRLFFGVLLYEPEMYFVIEVSVEKAPVGVCQSRAPVYQSD